MVNENGCVKKQDGGTKNSHGEGIKKLNLNPKEIGVDAKHEAERQSNAYI